VVLYYANQRKKGMEIVEKYIKKYIPFKKTFEGKEYDEQAVIEFIESYEFYNIEVSDSGKDKKFHMYSKKTVADNKQIEVCDTLFMEVDDNNIVRNVEFSTGIKYENRKVYHRDKKGIRLFFVGAVVLLGWMFVSVSSFFIDGINGIVSDFKDEPTYDYIDPEYVDSDDYDGDGDVDLDDSIKRIEEEIEQETIYGDEYSDLDNN
jgi:hypothetical protein